MLKSLGLLCGYAELCGLTVVILNSVDLMHGCTEINGLTIGYTELRGLLDGHCVLGGGLLKVRELF